MQLNGFSFFRCCLKFEDQFKQKTGVRPFQVATTIASACNYVFRKNFLKPDSIGLIPYGGYRRKERQSVMALKWLKFLSEKEYGIPIQHARNDGEKRVGPFKLDGYAIVDGQETAFEFYVSILCSTYVVCF